MGAIIEDVWPVYKRAYLQPNPDGSLHRQQAKRARDIAVCREYVCWMDVCQSDKGMGHTFTPTVWSMCEQLPMRAITEDLWPVYKCAHLSI
jgi:hypothetical protein